MRHRKKSEKFSRTRAQRKVLIKSLLRAVLIYERITTTESKAKALRTMVDRLITWGKQDSIHNRRLSYKWLNDHSLVKRLFEVIAPQFKDINGGYCRVIDLGFRKGDRAKISLLELTKLTQKQKKIKVKSEKTDRKEIKKVKDSVEPPTAVKHENKELKTDTKKEHGSKMGFAKGIKNIFKRGRES